MAARIIMIVLLLFLISAVNNVERAIERLSPETMRSVNNGAR